MQTISDPTSCPVEIHTNITVSSRTLRILVREVKQLGPFLHRTILPIRLGNCKIEEQAMRNLQYMTLSVLALTPLGATATEPAPPPPVRSIEVFNPTLRTHAVQAQCAGANMSIAWSSDGKGARLSTLDFDRKKASPVAIKQLNEFAATLGSDIFLAVECNNDGAIIRMLDYASAGSGKPKQILLNYVDGNVRLIRKYNLPD